MFGYPLTGDVWAVVYVDSIIVYVESLVRELVAMIANVTADVCALGY